MGLVPRCLQSLHLGRDWCDCGKSIISVMKIKIMNFPIFGMLSTWCFRTIESTGVSARSLVDKWEIRIFYRKIKIWFPIQSQAPYPSTVRTHHFSWFHHFLKPIHHFTGASFLCVTMLLFGSPSFYRNIILLEQLCPPNLSPSFYDSTLKNFSSVHHLTGSLLLHWN